MYVRDHPTCTCTCQCFPDERKPTSQNRRIACIHVHRQESTHTLSIHSTPCNLLTPSDLKLIGKHTMCLKQEYSISGDIEIRLTLMEEESFLHSLGYPLGIWKRLYLCGIQSLIVVIQWIEFLHKHTICYISSDKHLFLRIQLVTKFTLVQNEGQLSMHADWKTYMYLQLQSDPSLFPRIVTMYMCR